MSHEVTVDESAVDAVFSQFEGEQKQGNAEPGPGNGMVLAEPTESEWLAMAKMAAQILANSVCPNWSVPPETQMEWAEALAGCLDQLFPGGLANIANWGPWAKLAYASVMWGLCGMDYSTMTLKPLRAPIEGESEQVADDEGEGQKTEPAPATGQHFMG